MTDDEGAIRDLRDRLGRAEQNIASAASIAAGLTANIATLLASNAELKAEFKATADARRADQIEFMAGQRDIAFSIERKMGELTNRMDQRFIEFKTAEVAPLKEQLKALAAKVTIIGAGTTLFGVALKALGVGIPGVTK